MVSLIIIIVLPLSLCYPIQSKITHIIQSRTLSNKKLLLKKKAFLTENNKYIFLCF